jgi:hypothetical protein
VRAWHTPYLFEICEYIWEARQFLRVHPVHILYAANASVFAFQTTDALDSQFLQFLSQSIAKVLSSRTRLETRNVEVYELRRRPVFRGSLKSFVPLRN